MALSGYDPYGGLVLDMPEGARLRTLVKQLRVPGYKRLQYFIDGKRVGLWRKLSDGEEITCLRPLAGG